MHLAVRCSATRGQWNSDDLAVVCHYCSLHLQVQDMEEESSEEEDESAPPVLAGSGKKATPVPMPPREVQQPPPLPPTPDKVVVKKGYDPKQGAVNVPVPPFMQVTILICIMLKSPFITACLPFPSHRPSVFIFQPFLCPCVADSFVPSFAHSRNVLFLYRTE
jgi:hypothetical protein